MAEPLVKRSAGPPHGAIQHRSAWPGLEARSYLSGCSFPRHSHDQFGIGVMMSGAQRSWSCIGTVESGPGDLVMVNPGEMHDGLPLGETARHWHVLYLDPDLVAREVGGESPGQPEIAPTARDPALAARILDLVSAIGEGAEPLAIEGSLVRVLVETIWRHGLSGRPAPHDASAGVARARQRLDDAPERPTSLGELADLCGIGRFQLLRGFAREVGATPYAYLVQRRLHLARRLLAIGVAPAETALRAGFADQSHLTRHFRRQFGVTPARYRAAVA